MFDGSGFDFALILFILLVITFVLWLADKLVFAKRRGKGAKEPWWVEYGASFFPVILIVFALRSFIVEPFKIPSESMVPTLLVGDFILVNKYAYGIRLPVINKKIIDVGEPKRGEVMVFRFPKDPNINYIKRVVGLPGDRVVYANKHLSINGQAVPMQAQGNFLIPSKLYYAQKLVEKLGDTEHWILNDRDSPPGLPVPEGNYPFRENCHYDSSGFNCTVPPGHYFMMGDNRDASSDSRVWGFVPERNIVGRAFFIWFNFGDLGRIGGFK
ncbi:MAG: signal peptidase I [Rhodocyclaceae bacterium]|nr:signal peptidase I [Rhodocyclaceae bacterium]MBX3668377.1 signal peptidase I [Rhodocyclaceae bacterium]